MQFHALARRRLRQFIAEVPDIEVVGECEDGRRAVSLVKSLAPGNVNNPSSVLNVTFSNNTIGVIGVANSGSLEGAGLKASRVDLIPFDTLATFFQNSLNTAG